MCKVGVILLNYRRPILAEHLLGELRNQSCSPRILVVNNDASKPLEGDVTLTASVNLRTGISLAVAPLLQTRFIVKIDDDMRLTDSHVLTDALKYMRESGEELIAYDGLNLVNGKYESPGCNILAKKGQNPHVDIGKGRFMMYRRELIYKVPLGAARQHADIALSVCAGGAVLPSVLAGRVLRKAGTGPESACREKGHKEARQEAVDFWMSLT